MPTSTPQKIALGLGLAVVALIAALVLYVYIAMTWSYSEGERAGFLQKISKKGWVCKTWEGELSLVAMPGAPEFDTKRDKLLIHIGRASNLPLQEGQLCVLGRFSDVQSL